MAERRVRTGSRGASTRVISGSTMVYLMGSVRIQ
jgi:hypothetical protein